MAFSLALVDFDGTLADSMPYWLRLPADTLRAAGLPQPEGFAEYIRSVPIREIARDMGAKYPQLEVETPLAVRWSAEMAAHYAREIPLKPGAKKLLQTLRAAGLRVYILSATRHALLDPAIERLGVAPLVDGVYAEEETGSKRTEAPYAFFRDRFGVPYEKMLLAEDAPRNLAAAEALGKNANARAELQIIEAVRNGTIDFPQIASKLSAIDFNFFGIDLTQTPKFSFDIFHDAQPIWVMPIIAFLAQMLTSALSLVMQKKLNPDAPNMAGMMLTMPLLSLFIGFTLPGGVAFYWACSSLIGGLIQVGVQQFYGPQKMLSRERLKELNKECDFEENQLKKIKTNQTLLNGEAAEK